MQPDRLCPETAIPSHRAFEDLAREEWRRAYEIGAPVALTLVAIDEFEAFRARHGAKNSTLCLRQVAGVLARTLTRGGDVVARGRTGEFAAVLRDTHLRGALYLGNALVEEISGMYLRLSQGMAEPLSVSVGVAASVPTDPSSVGSLLNAANEALYRARAAGGNRVAS